MPYYQQDIFQKYLESNFLISLHTFAIIIGILSVVIYLAYIGFVLKSYNSLKLEKGIEVYLSITSVIYGIRVVFISFDETVCDFSLIEHTYISVGGICIIWICSQSLIKIFKNE